MTTEAQREARRQTMLRLNSDPAFAAKRNERARDLGKKHLIRVEPTAFELSDDLAYIVGVVMGDGAIGKRAIYLQATDFDFVAAFRETCLRQFGRCGGIKEEAGRSMRAPKNGQTYVGSTSWKVCVSSKQVADFLRTVTLDWLQGFSQSQKIAWIRGLWDSEGCIGRDRNGFRITLAMTDPNTVFCYQKILASLGIVTSFRGPYNNGGEYMPLWYSTFGRLSDVTKFFDLISPTIVRKRQIFLEALDRYKLLVNRHQKAVG